MSRPRQNILTFLTFSALIMKGKPSRTDLNMVKQLCWEYYTFIGSWIHIDDRMYKVVIHRVMFLSNVAWTLSYWERATNFYLDILDRSLVLCLTWMPVVDDNIAQKVALCITTYIPHNRWQPSPHLWDAPRITSWCWKGHAWHH